jgi:hypothetical protein
MWIPLLNRETRRPIDLVTPLIVYLLLRVHLAKD